MVPGAALVHLAAVVLRPSRGWLLRRLAPAHRRGAADLDQGEAAGRRSGDVWCLRCGLPASAQGIWVGVGCVLHSTILFPVESLRSLLGLVRCRSMAWK